MCVWCDPSPQSGGDSWACHLLASPSFPVPSSPPLQRCTRKNQRDAQCYHTSLNKRQMEEDATKLPTWWGLSSPHLSSLVGDITTLQKVSSLRLETAGSVGRNATGDIRDSRCPFINTSSRVSADMLSRIPYSLWQFPLDVSLPPRLSRERGINCLARSIGNSLRTESCEQGALLGQWMAYFHNCVGLKHLVSLI